MKGAYLITAFQYLTSLQFLPAFCYNPSTHAFLTILHIIFCLFLCLGSGPSWFSFHSLLLHTCTPSTLGFNGLQQQSVSKGNVINHLYVSMTKPVAIVTGKLYTKLKKKSEGYHSTAPPSPHIAWFHKCLPVLLCLIVSPPSRKHSEIKINFILLGLRRKNK